MYQSVRCCSFNRIGQDFFSFFSLLAFCVAFWEKIWICRLCILWCFVGWNWYSYSSKRRSKRTLKALSIRIELSRYESSRMFETIIFDPNLDSFTHTSCRLFWNGENSADQKSHLRRPRIKWAPLNTYPLWPGPAMKIFWISAFSFSTNKKSPQILKRDKMTKCYWPDGAEISYFYACNLSATVSPCCPVGSVCLDNKLCQLTTFFRGACTDATWKSPDCPQFCLGR